MVSPDDVDEHYGSTVLAEFKGLAASQATQAERVATRAQQIAGFTVAVFAVAQTAALSSFNSAHLSSGDKHWVLGLAMGAAAFAGFAGVASVLAATLNRYEAVGYIDLTEAAEDAADEDQDVAIILAVRYRRQLKAGESVLENKRGWLRATEGLAIVAIVLIVSEVIVALATRI
jgi:hypothetical protein